MTFELGFKGCLGARASARGGHAALAFESDFPALFPAPAPPSFQYLEVNVIAVKPIVLLSKRKVTCSNELSQLKGFQENEELF